MTSDLIRRYTETDLKNARTKGQVIGWLQGGGVTLAVLLAVGLVGWIPGALLMVAVVVLVWKLLSR